VGMPLLNLKKAIHVSCVTGMKPGLKQLYFVIAANSTTLLKNDPK